MTYHPAAQDGLYADTAASHHNLVTFQVTRLSKGMYLILWAGARTSLESRRFTSPTVVIISWGSTASRPCFRFLVTWGTRTGPARRAWPRPATAPASSTTTTKAAWRTRPGSSSTTTTSRGRVKAVTSWSPSWHFHLHSDATHTGSIQGPNSIFCITRVFKFYKGKAWGVPGYPDINQWSIFGECRFEFMFGICISKVSHIDLTVCSHFSRHCVFLVQEFRCW